MSLCEKGSGRLDRTQKRWQQAPRGRDWSGVVASQGHQQLQDVEEAREDTPRALGSTASLPTVSFQISSL